VDAQLVIVGIGTQAAELERRARRNGVAEHTHFLGFVPDPALPSAYAVADVFCMPGVAELQSLVTLEAMATGLPVVAADAVALPHLVRNGQNGWRYPPGDVAMLADRLAAVLIEPDLARTMGSTSRLIAVEHDSSRSIQRFESLYRDLIAATVDTPT
jgi:glycosyltransferase involved in cell wall biosynthesis